MDEQEEEENEGNRSAAVQQSIHLPLLFPGGETPSRGGDARSKGRGGSGGGELSIFLIVSLALSLSLWLLASVSLSRCLSLSRGARWSVATRSGAEAEAGLTGLSTLSRCLRNYPHPPSEVTKGFQGRGSEGGKGWSVCVCVCVCVGGGILIFRYLSVTVVLREWVKHKWRREEGRKEGRKEGTREGRGRGKRRTV